MAKSIVYEKSFEFALKIIDLYLKLRDEKEYVISKQILRSGTSIGANLKESLAGQSRADFLAKAYISFKEANETEYWLELLDRSTLTTINIKPYIDSIQEIIRMLSSITKTTSQSLHKK